MSVDFVTWDWKEQLPLDELNEALAKYGVSVVEIEDTGSDQYAVIVTPILIDKADAQELWDEHEAV